MHTIIGSGVNEVYARAMVFVREHGVPQDSRAGPVLSVLEPVVLETLRPQERVLLDPQRDANPFFHLFEALWMLAGRNDAAFLNRFVHDFGARYGEPDGRIHDAYGHRWRHHFGFDQLDEVVRKLRANPLDRQAVITMWDPTPLWGPLQGYDEEWGGNDLVGEWRGRPCNTHIYPRIAGPFRSLGRGGDEVVDSYLDLMVCCRSNDVVYGATGANAVHFAVLLEYLAGRIGCQVGVLRQMTTNLHGYVDVLEKVGVPSTFDPYLNTVKKGDGIHGTADSDINVFAPNCSSLPIGKDWEHWDEDLREFLDWAEGTDEGFVSKNTWFQAVARPMWLSHSFWKRHNADKAMYWADLVAAPDWRLAAQQWLQRRIDRREKARVG